MSALEILTNEAAWEAMWAPYDEATYRAVLDQVHAGDIVLEIGAGDLRFARRLAGICRRVYAIEIQGELLRFAVENLTGRFPKNLIVQHGDARELPFPTGVTAAVLLMRHCTHFRLYADKLKAVGVKRLITNARWRMGVEVIELLAGRMPFPQVDMGWYACWCGASGFKPGSPERLTSELDQVIHEVSNCPWCKM